MFVEGILMQPTGSEIPSTCPNSGSSHVVFPGQKAQGIDRISVWSLNLTIYFHPWPENPTA